MHHNHGAKCSECWHVNKNPQHLMQGSQDRPDYKNFGFKEGDRYDIICENCGRILEVVTHVSYSYETVVVEEE